MGRLRIEKNNRDIYYNDGEGFLDDGFIYNSKV